MTKQRIKNIGPNFETEYRRSLIWFCETHKHAWWERIYDLKDYVGKHCPRCHAPLNRCSSCGYRLPRLGMRPPKRRGDFHMGYDGRYVLIECKATRVKNGFPTYNLKEHQLQSLVDNQLSGNYSLIEIKSVYSKENYLYTIDALAYSGLSGSAKFISWSELEEYGIAKTERTPARGRPYYDLSYLEGL